jgi:hypothetical protein
MQEGSGAEQIGRLPLYYCGSSYNSSTIRICASGPGCLGSIKGAIGTINQVRPWTRRTEVHRRSYRYGDPDLQRCIQGSGS